MACEHMISRLIPPVHRLNNGSGCSNAPATSPALIAKPPPAAIGTGEYEAECSTPAWAAFVPLLIRLMMSPVQPKSTLNRKIALLLLHHCAAEQCPQRREHTRCIGELVVATRSTRGLDQLLNFVVHDGELALFIFNTNTLTDKAFK